MKFRNTRAPEREEDVEISAPAGKYRVLVHTGARVEVLIERPDSEAGRADALRYLRASSRPAALARGTTVIQWGARAKSFEDALRTAARRDAKPEAAPAARPVAKVVPAEPMPEREPPRDHEAEHDAAVEATRREASAQLRGMSSQTTLMQALEEDLSETDTAPTRCELCHVESPDHLLSCANLPALPLVAALEAPLAIAAPTAASSSVVPRPSEPRPAAPTEECAVAGCSMLVGKVRPHAHPQLKVLCPVHRSKGGYVLAKHPDVNVAAWLSEGRHSRHSKPIASKPVASMPVASKPVASMPVASKPVASMPVASMPVASKPVASMPVASMPVASMPVADATSDESMIVYMTRVLSVVARLGGIAKAEALAAGGAR